MTVSWERVHEAAKRQMRRANPHYQSEQKEGAGVSVSNSHTRACSLAHTHARHPSTHVSPRWHPHGANHW